MVSEKGLDKDQIGWTREEITIHKRLRHPYICTLHGSFKSLSNIMICLSLCRGGSLVDMMGAVLDAGELLAAAHVHGAFVQLLSALRYLESVGFVHRDLKLDNLVWADAQRTRLQLIDFGYASTTYVHSQYSGLAHFAAPEVHAADEGGPPFSCRTADVWSAGVVLFVRLSMALPFNGEEEMPEERAALRRRVCKGVPDGSLPAERPAAACDLVARMLIPRSRKCSRTSGWAARERAPPLPDLLLFGPVHLVFSSIARTISKGRFNEERYITSL